MIRAEEGCTCLSNIYQRRCHQHVLRLESTLDRFEVVEDYTVDKIFSSPNPPARPRREDTDAGPHAAKPISD
jgi:hypothetical protein